MEKHNNKNRIVGICPKCGFGLVKADPREKSILYECEICLFEIPKENTSSLGFFGRRIILHIVSMYLSTIYFFKDTINKYKR